MSKIRRKEKLQSCSIEVPLSINVEKWMVLDVNRVFNNISYQYKWYCRSFELILCDGVHLRWYYEFKEFMQKVQLKDLTKIGHIKIQSLCNIHRSSHIENDLKQLQLNAINKLPPQDEQLFAKSVPLGSIAKLKLFVIKLSKRAGVTSLTRQLLENILKIINSNSIDVTNQLFDKINVYYKLQPKQLNRLVDLSILLFNYNLLISTKLSNSIPQPLIDPIPPVIKHQITDKSKIKLVTGKQINGGDEGDKLKFEAMKLVEKSLINQRMMNQQIRIPCEEFYLLDDKEIDKHLKQIPDNIKWTPDKHQFSQYYQNFRLCYLCPSSDATVEPQIISPDGLNNSIWSDWEQKQVSNCIQNHWVNGNLDQVLFIDLQCGARNVSELLSNLYILSDKEDRQLLINKYEYYEFRSTNDNNFMKSLNQLLQITESSGCGAILIPVTINFDDLNTLVAPSTSLDVMGNDENIHYITVLSQLSCVCGW